MPHLLRRQTVTEWMPPCFCCLQVDQILPEKPASTTTLWHSVYLDVPAPDGTDQARCHWTLVQRQAAQRSMGNLMLLHAEGFVFDAKAEFANKKVSYRLMNSDLFPRSAAVLNQHFFSYVYEYVERQKAYAARLSQVYEL